MDLKSIENIVGRNNEIIPILSQLHILTVSENKFDSLEEKLDSFSLCP